MFGTLLLDSVPEDKKKPLETAYSYIAARLKETTNGEVDVSAGAVEHWIKGRRSPTAQALGALSRALNWSDAQTARAVRLLSPVSAEAA